MNGLALDVVEGIVVGVLTLLLLLWGPEKVAELMRLWRRARREIERAGSELLSFAEGAARDVLQEVPLDDARLLDVARKLGVETKGRTREELRRELEARMAAARPAKG
jgi:sec-independent protein translocase protein TatA